MDRCAGHCNRCEKGVELVLQEVGSKFLTPVLTAAGTAIGGKTAKRRNRFRNAVIGGVAGLVTSLVLDAVTPPVKRWVCGECGCSDVRVIDAA